MRAFVTVILLSPLVVAAAVVLAWLVNRPVSFSVFIQKLSEDVTRLFF